MIYLHLLTLLLISTTVKCTVLEDYVQEPDPSFSYRLLRKERLEGAYLFIYNMTSLRWGQGLVKNDTLWWHFVRVIVPDVINYPDAAVLVADDGDNSQGIDEPGHFFTHSRNEPVRIGLVVAFVQSLPNGPLFFKNDPSGREHEDTDTLAWSLATFLKDTSKPQSIILLPMVKASVRAMDMITEVIKDLRGNNISRFIMNGQSKRGWSTWLTAAVDKRIVGFVSMNLDILNLKKALHRQWQLYGGWSFVMRSFWAYNFTTYLDTPEGELMASIIDPLVYKDKYTMPKVILQATADEFNIPDNSHLYFDQLPSPKYMSMIANTDHWMLGHTAKLLTTLSSFVDLILTKSNLPTLNWNINNFASNRSRLTLTLGAEDDVSSVKFYHSHIKSKRRDFRFLEYSSWSPVHNIEPRVVIWHEAEAVKMHYKTYVADFTAPSEGYLGFFMKAFINGPNRRSLEYSTNVYIIPDVLPFPPCYLNTCRGTLV